MSRPIVKQNHMVDEKCNRILFSESHKWIVPSGIITTPNTNDKRNQLLIASMNKNLEGLGFLMDADLIKKLEELPEDDLVKTLYQLYDACVASIGAKELKKATVMYPNFPKDVMTMDDFEIYTNQISHYLGVYLFGVTILPEEEVEDREPFLDATFREKKLISLGTVSDLDTLMQNRILSGISLSKSKIDDMKTYMDTYGLSKFSQLYDGRNIPNKENACQIAKAVYDYSMERQNMISDSARKAIEKALPNGMDVLRFAALLSNNKTVNAKEKYRTYVWTDGDRSKGAIEWRTKRVEKKIENDPALSGKVLFKLSRPEEHLIKGLLAGTKSLFEDIWMRPSLYKTLGKQISMTKNCPERLSRAYDNLCKGDRVSELGKPIRTPYSFLQSAMDELKKGNVKMAEFTAKNFPGVYSRGFVSLLNHAPNIEAFTDLCDLYKDYCTNVPVKEQIKLLNYLQQIPSSSDRVIYESKINRYVQTEMPEFKYRIGLNDAIDAVYASIMAQLGKAPAMGKVYIDPELVDVALPGNNERTASKGSVLPAGSILEDHADCNIIRIFSWWTNTEKDRVDIDTSVSFLDADCNPVAECAYYSTKAYVDGDIAKECIAVHSGDIVDGGSIDGNGAAEFVDIDKKLCQKANVRYVVMSVSSYCRQNFCDIPNLKWGYMERDGNLEELAHHPNVFRFNGETYEPSTVDSCVDINTKATQTIPAIYDIVTGQMIWLDQPIRDLSDQLKNTQNTDFREQMKLMIEYQNHSPRGNLYELFALHAQARGELVTDIHDTDMIFSRKGLDKEALGISEETEVISTNDYSRIVSEFMTITPDTEEDAPSLEKTRDYPELEFEEEYDLSDL